MVAYTVTGLKKMSSNKPDLAGELSCGGINIVQARVSDKHTGVYSLANHTEESKVSDRTIKKRRDKKNSKRVQTDVYCGEDFLSVLFDLF